MRTATDQPLADQLDSQSDKERLQTASSNRRTQTTTSKEASARRMPAGSAHDFSFTSPRRSHQRFSNSIHDYELCEVLGRGGFGVVVRAISHYAGSDGFEVAIKMIDKSLMRTSNMTRRVANEVEIHWQLRHSSILELYNYFEDNDHVYLVMELCKNGELFSYIQRRRSPLSEPEARSVLVQLINGLAYMHANNILHRDLKLSNLLLTETHNLKIADFGLATRLGDAGGEQKTMCGTPNYISPEIVSRRPYGLETDLWSLGCMMVTLLTGSPPFQSNAVKSTLDKVAKLEYHLPDFLSSEARDLIHRLLQLDPKSRIPLSRVLDHPFFDRSRPISTLMPVSGSLPEKTPKQHDDPKQYSFQKNSNQHPQKSYTTNAETSHQKHEQRITTSDNASTLLPLSTSHLKPMRQQTKYGIAEIQTNGNVVLDFTNDPHIIVISSDGETIQIFPRSNSSQPHPSPIEYTRSTLPNTFTKKYRYASRLVDLVRAKTPRIVFYSPQAKCMLMENGPVPDFEMVFYIGVRVHTSASRRMLEIRVPQKIQHQFPSACEAPASSRSRTDAPEYYMYQIDLGQSSRAPTTHVSVSATHVSSAASSSSSIASSSWANVSVPVDLQPIFKHAQECLRQCMEVDRSERHNSATNTKYPIIIKSSQTKVTSSTVAAAPPRTESPPPPSSISATTRLSSRSTLAVSVSRPGLTESQSDSRKPRHENNDGYISVRRDVYVANTEPISGACRSSTIVSGATTAASVITASSVPQKPLSDHTKQIYASSASDSAALTHRSLRQASHNMSETTLSRSNADDTVNTMNRRRTQTVSVDNTTPQMNYGDIKTRSHSTASQKQHSTNRITSSSSSVHSRADSHAATSIATTDTPPDILETPFSFLSDIGWCFRHPQRGFLVLFSDGTRMLVHPNGKHLEFASSHLEPFVTHAISTALAPNLKSRLGQFTTLVKMLRQQQTRSNS